MPCVAMYQDMHATHLSQPSQHAELTEDFKQYLESKGLSEASLFTILHWVLIALFCKLIPVISELIPPASPTLNCLPYSVATAVVCALISLASCIVFIKKHKGQHENSERQPLLDTSVQ